MASDARWVVVAGKWIEVVSPFTLFLPRDEKIPVPRGMVVAL
jgi:hypothetical protein